MQIDTIINKHPQQPQPLSSTTNAALLHDAIQARNDCARHGIAILSPSDPSYPATLAAQTYAPKLLFAQGHIDLLCEGKRVAIVGTRQATKWALQAAANASGLAASLGFSVISGLAQGCDTAAHNGALAAGGHTISIEASALTTVYPRASEPLAQRILSQYGCRISAQAPGQQTQKYHFVVRDRFQAALCDAAILVEADGGSGSLHCMREALRLGKPVACLVPGRPLSAGVAHMLAKGAAAIPNAKALEEWLTGE